MLEIMVVLAGGNWFWRPSDSGCGCVGIGGFAWDGDCAGLVMLVVSGMMVVLGIRVVEDMAVMLTIVVALPITFLYWG